MYIECSIVENAIVGQKNAILEFMACNSPTPLNVQVIEHCLALVADLWEGVVYNYKTEEIRKRIKEWKEQ